MTNSHWNAHLNTKILWQTTIWLKNLIHLDANRVSRMMTTPGAGLWSTRQHSNNRQDEQATNDIYGDDEEWPWKKWYEPENERFSLINYHENEYRPWRTEYEEEDDRLTCECKANLHKMQTLFFIWPDIK